MAGKKEESYQEKMARKQAGAPARQQKREQIKKKQSSMEIFKQFQKPKKGK